MERRYKIKLNASKIKKALTFIDVLQEKFPIAFPKKPRAKVPLAIGTFEMLGKLKEELGVSKNLIRASLQLWCTKKRYWLALAKPGRLRLDIYSNTKGVVLEKQAVYAKKKLKEGYNIELSES